MDENTSLWSNFFSLSFSFSYRCIAFDYLSRWLENGIIDWLTAVWLCLKGQKMCAVNVDWWQHFRLKWRHFSSSSRYRMQSRLSSKCNRIILIPINVRIFFFFSLTINTPSIDLDGNHEIVIAKFHYNAQENHELSIGKNERLQLLDDSCLWWKVKRLDSDDIG